MENTSIILPFRYSSEDRKRAMQFVLKWLDNNLPEPEILIVEQDSRSRIDFQLPGRCRHIFLRNEGLFNKCWGFNVAVNNTAKEVLLFHDSDIFMSRPDYLETIRSCAQYEAVNPSENEIQNVINSDAAKLTFELFDKRYIRPFAGGIFAIRKSSLHKIGGWNEHFAGWGSEDNEISFRILNLLTTIHLDCLVYHIEHVRGENDWKKQDTVESNRGHFAEIATLSGNSLDRHIERLKTYEQGKTLKYDGILPEPPLTTPRFIMAVTVYNQMALLKKFIRQWNETRLQDATWTLIIADDGSDDGTLFYLDELSIDRLHIHVIRNRQAGMAGQLNTILGFIESIEYDVCFISDVGISFIKAGWEEIYWSTIRRIGYEMLCFFDKRWNPRMVIPRPLIAGNLANYCRPEDVQDFFFTLTPGVISSIGYFDTNDLGIYGLEKIDYIWRGCRAGFNAPGTPFDVLNSNEYLKITNPFSLHYSQSYLLPMPGDFTVRRHAWRVVYKSRIYIPRHDFVNLKDKAEIEARMIMKLRQGRTFLERTLKKKHNLNMKWNLRFLILFMDRLAGMLLRIGIMMKNIDK